jgi:hypothetical protein
MNYRICTYQSGQCQPALIDTKLSLDIAKVESHVVRDRITDTRIFSPHTVARPCVTIGRYWYLFKRLTAVSACRFYRFEHIVAYSSGKVVAK